MSLIIIIIIIMPVAKEANGLSISDNKRPDGLTLLPWQEGNRSPGT